MLRVYHERRVDLNVEGMHPESAHDSMLLLGDELLVVYVANADRDWYRFLLLVFAHLKFGRGVL